MNKFDAVVIERKYKKATLEEFISVGLELREKKDSINWELGDLASEVTKEFGPKYLSEFSKGIGIEVSTIKRYRDVARAYTPEQREAFKMLSWTHFRLVAANDNREALLRAAIDNTWSVEKLAVMARGQSPVPTPEPVESKEQPVMEKCTQCGGWKFLEKDLKLCPDDGRCDYIKDLAN